MSVVSISISEEFSLTSHDISLIGSAYLYGYAVVQFLAGIIVSKLGARFTLGVFLSISALGCILFSAASDLTAITAARAICGMGVAVVLTSALAIFIQWFKPEYFGRLCSWYFCFGGLGAIWGTAPMAFLNEYVGWRFIFGTLGIVTLCLALCCFIFVKNAPVQNSPTKTNTAPSLRTIFSGLRTVSHNNDFIRLCLWFFCISGIYYSFFALWGGHYLLDVYNLPKEHIGGILSMGAMGFVFGSPLYTLLFEHCICSYRKGLALSCAAAFICCMLLALLPQYLSLWSLYLLCLCLGIACNAPNALAYASARNLFGAQMAAAITGILGFCAFIGGALLQFLGGVILEAAESNAFGTSNAYKLFFIPYCIYAAAAFYNLLKLTESCSNPKLNARKK